MSNHSMDMMKMFFHFGEREMILFKWWKTGTVSGLLLSVFVVFMICILYEAIKGLRYFIAYGHAQQRRAALQHSASNRAMSPSAENRDTVSETSVSFAPLLRLSGATKKLFTGYRVLQGLLYGVQALLAYLIMLIVMTFNGWLILSVVFGEAVGYFLFTGTPLVEGDLSDCC